jgi:hypothetical protein
MSAWKGNNKYRTTKTSQGYEGRGCKVWSEKIN